MTTPTDRTDWQVIGRDGDEAYWGDQESLARQSAHRTGGRLRRRNVRTFEPEYGEWEEA